MNDQAIGSFWDCDCFTDGPDEDKRRVVRASFYDALMESHMRVLNERNALAADLTESRQLLGVYRVQRDAAEERLRALETELAESTRHRDQNRETAVALQMRVSALEAALRKYGIELVEWTSGVWTYNCRACDHGNGTTFLPTDIEHDPACELMALLKDTALETPAKYGTCPLCTGQGGAHFPTCEYSPAETTAEWRCKCGVHNQRVETCGNCGRARHSVETK